MLVALHLSMTQFLNVGPETVNSLWQREVETAGGRGIRYGAVFYWRLE